MKLTTRNKLWLVSGGVVLVGICLFASLKFVKRHQATLPRTDADHYLQVGNLKRAYDLHVPSSYTGKKPVPLMIALHGTGGNGKSMQAQTGFNQLADREEFIVVYPDAVNTHWNARRGGKPDTTNDLGFISALIDELDKQYEIDRSRVYAAGFSNGATFTHRLGCELSDKITAIASVAATIPVHVTANCQSNKSLPVVLIHGTKDEAFPYKVGAKGVLAAPDTLKYWAKHNRCSQDIQTKPLSSVSGVQVSTSKQCPNGANVALYTVQEGGHDWENIHPEANVLKGTAKEFSPSEVIWDFFTSASARS